MSMIQLRIGGYTLHHLTSCLLDTHLAKLPYHSASLGSEEVHKAVKGDLVLDSHFISTTADVTHVAEKTIKLISCCVICEDYHLSAKRVEFAVNETVPLVSKIFTSRAVTFDVEEIVIRDFWPQMNGQAIVLGERLKKIDIYGIPATRVQKAFFRHIFAKIPKGIVVTWHKVVLLSAPSSSERNEQKGLASSALASSSLTELSHRVKRARSKSVRSRKPSKRGKAKSSNRTEESILGKRRRSPRIAKLKLVRR